MSRLTGRDVNVIRDHAGSERAMRDSMSKIRRDALELRERILRRQLRDAREALARTCRQPWLAERIRRGE